jgi:hypothetical protein
MLSYDKWKLLNESLGSTVLGLGRTQSLGLISNIPGLQEKTCGMGEYDEPEEGDGENPRMDFEVDLEDTDDPEAGEEESEEETMDVEDEDDDDEEEEDEYEDDEDDDDDDEDEESDEEEEFSDEDGEVDMDSETEEEDEVGDDDENMDMMRQLKALKPESATNKGKSLAEAEWWKSVASMIGTMTPNGNIVFEANENEKEEEEEEEKKVKADPAITGAVKTALSRMQGALDLRKVENISPQKVKALVRALLAYVLEHNRKTPTTQVRKIFMDAIKEYTAGR